jgi:palmitoyl-protein thioesterase
MRSTELAAVTHTHTKTLFPNFRRPSQNLLTPTTYWHDLNEQRYHRGSTFLAIINNERGEINADYVANLKALRKLVLVKYETDESIIPNESAFFGYWNAWREVINMEETELYRNDKLGLREMKESAQLVFLTSPGGHLEMNEQWFIDNILPHLK